MKAIDDRFLEAVVNGQHTVLGRRLEPLCLANLLVLYAVESPLVSGGEVTRPDLAIAVEVLSNKYGLLSVPASVVPSKALQKAALKCDLALEMQKLTAYLADFYNKKDYDDFLAGMGKSGKRCGTPWILANAVFLQRHLHLSTEEVWSMPLGLVEWHIGAVMEQVTDARVVSEEERALREWCKAAVKEKP